MIDNYNKWQKNTEHEKTNFNLLCEICSFESCLVEEYKVFEGEFFFERMPLHSCSD